MLLDLTLLVGPVGVVNKQDNNDVKDELWNVSSNGTINIYQLARQCILRGTEKPKAKRMKLNHVVFKIDLMIYGHVLILIKMQKLS